MTPSPRSTGIRAGLGSLFAFVVAAALAAQATGTHPISGRRFAPVMGYTFVVFLALVPVVLLLVTLLGLTLPYPL